ncbi:cell division protein ZapE, partial [Xanthomonas citri pv. citri]|nr:cell division protein ZapE [Xanthomonas citri pv. citri]
IQVLAEQFEVIRVDGEDYRHRGLTAAPDPLPDDQVVATAEQNFPDAGVLAVDDFDALTAMLSRVHPSRYRELVKDVDVLALHDV